jgi:hypothetical protein
MMAFALHDLILVDRISFITFYSLLNISHPVFLRNADHGDALIDDKPHSLLIVFLISFSVISRSAVDVIRCPFFSHHLEFIPFGLHS